jgi:endonuclease YncB( thermonuclease family)
MTHGLIPIPPLRRAARHGPARARRWLLAAAVLGAIQLVWQGLGAGQAGAAEIVGRPRVVDGDSLTFAGRLVHLWGVDAPERKQTCGSPSGPWPCGEEARWALLNRVSPHWVTCVEMGEAADGAVQARCYLAGVGQQEVNAWLVAEGWALADRAVTDAYVAEEHKAQAAGKGLWRGAFEAPWDWRRDKRAAP